MYIKYNSKINYNFKIILIVDAKLFEYAVILFVISYVSLPFAISIIFSKFFLVKKLNNNNKTKKEIFKKINSFIRSYNRVLTILISDSFYELLFVQNIACFAYIKLEWNLEFKTVVNSLIKVNKNYLINNCVYY